MSRYRASVPQIFALLSKKVGSDFFLCCIVPQKPRQTKARGEHYYRARFAVITFGKSMSRAAFNGKLCIELSGRDNDKI